MMRKLILVASLAAIIIIIIIDLRTQRLQKSVSLQEPAPSPAMA